MQKINELKRILNCETSEQLFDITPQPENQCPFVDKQINEWSKATREISWHIKDLEKYDDDSVREAASDMDWQISSLDIEAGFEQMRAKCSEIRDWGQQWKDLAKKLLSEREDLNDWLSDENYSKIEEFLTKN